MAKSKKSENKSIVWYGALFAILIFITFFAVFKDQDFNTMMHTIMSSNLLWILLGLGLMVGYFLVQSWNIYRLLHQLGEKITFRQAIKYTIVEFFFCAVTPGASGGQPVEIFYMAKDKISISSATIAIMIQTCGIQVAVMLLGMLSLLFAPHLIAPNSLFLFVIGLLINGTALIVLLVGLFFPKLTRVLVKAVFDFIEKLTHKKFEKQRSKVNQELDKYASSSEYIKNHLGEFRNAMLRSILQMSLYFLVPFCVYHALGLSGESVLALFAMQAILFMATSGLPLPGAVGVSEAVFLGLYSASFGEGLVNAAVLISRGITFYLFVLIGVVVVGIVTFRKRHKAIKK